MERNNITITTGIFSGVLLTAMITTNSYLSTWNSPLIAAWFAHGSGALFSFLLLVIIQPKIQKTSENRPPLWCYLGGIPGALTVVLAAITINSPLKLAASLSLMLTGQVIYGIVSDKLGWFGMVSRKFSFFDFISILLILSGCGSLLLAK